MVESPVSMPTWAIHAHSSEDMFEVDDGSVQLIVTSPSEPNRIVQGAVFQLNLSMFERIFRECYRVLRDSGVFILNVGHPLTTQDAYSRLDGETAMKFLSYRAKYPYLFVASAERAGLNFISDAYSNRWGDIMVDGVEPHYTFTCTHEHYFVFCKKVPVWYGDVAPSLFIDASRPRHSEFNTDILTKLISVYTKVGDTILDPMIGSGLLIAYAYRMGRNSIGYEVDEKRAAKSEAIIREIQESLEFDMPVSITLEDGRKVSMPPLER